MTAWQLDDDTMIALVAVFAAAVCLAFAVRRFRDGGSISGAALLIGAALLGFVAYFFAAFQMRMF